MFVKKIRLMRGLQDDNYLWYLKFKFKDISVDKYKYIIIVMITFQFG